MNLASTRGDADPLAPVSLVRGALFVRGNRAAFLATPGHTLSQHSLRLDWDGMSAVVAGDSVPTRDFWRERRAHRPRPERRTNPLVRDF